MEAASEWGFTDLSRGQGGAPGALGSVEKPPTLSSGFGGSAGVPGEGCLGPGQRVLCVPLSVDWLSDLRLTNSI